MEDETTSIPPNVPEERRHDAGSRKIIKRLDQIEDTNNKRWELFEEEIKQKFEHHVSYKALFGSIIAVAAGIIGGTYTLTAITRSQVSQHKEIVRAQIEKVQERTDKGLDRIDDKVDTLLRTVLNDSAERKKGHR